LLLGLFMLNVPLNQAVLCVESDGHLNIENSVVGSCEKSLCEQSQSEKSPDSHVDDCENCTDISLSQSTIASKVDFQSILPDSSLLQVAWVLDSFSIGITDSNKEFYPPSSEIIFRNSPLAHRQTIVLLI
jgi:hypothetical protein